MKLKSPFGMSPTGVGPIIYASAIPFIVLGCLFPTEGDFSGGTHNQIERDWLPIKGTSRIYNYAFKEKARKDAITIKTLAIPCAGCNDNTYKCMMDMVNTVMILTNEVELNPEY